ncbi:hypothetical protein [Gluconobacter oxydans]|uniref:hypothetical protein n=1 Tax=Gluconobacter oxydans TaxID=442 RepID=UPI000784263F|nr:hypothetical protein [Gluconobacter oxydans]KXV12594.1 hypothetical protein AD932_06705 [Gluconobacter oxydans]
MSEMTDPRVEAAARAVKDAMLRQGKSPDARDLAQAAIKAADAVAWRPISEAPRDGTTILLYDDHLDRMEAGWTFEGDLWQPTGMPHKQSINHWMPLPPPPVMGECDE